MRCPFCKGNVIGEKEVVILVGEGPAHTECYRRHAFHSRQFRGLDLQALDDNGLLELKDMVLMEMNSRVKTDTDVELFA